MRLGLLGDIHGNYLALEAVLASAVDQGVDELIITGDLVGYYFWPKETIELIDSSNVTIVKGNHEGMLEDARQNPSILPKIEQKYGCGLRIALEELTPQQLDWLALLPCSVETTFGGLKTEIYHGSPWDLNQYIYPSANSDILIRFAKMDCDLVILGHTHYPMVLKCAKTTVVNPGSVGQPRNKVPGAHWAIVDTKSMEVDFLTEVYDYDQVINSAQIRKPYIPYLWEVLTRT